MIEINRTKITELVLKKQNDHCRYYLKGVLETQRNLQTKPSNKVYRGYSTETINKLLKLEDILYTQNKVQKTELD